MLTGRRSIFAVILLVCCLAFASAPLRAQDATPETASATPETAGAPSPRDEMILNVIDAESQEIGTVAIVEMPDGSLSISVNASLPPGEHGIHIHETGICDAGSDEPFTSAGGHYNPGNTQHGGPPQGSPAATDTTAATPTDDTAHAGDLGNISAGEDGIAILTITTTRIDLQGLGDEDGSAIVVHADRDDLQTDPSGNSGARIACGVIFKPMGEATPASSPVSEGTPVE